MTDIQDAIQRFLDSSAQPAVCDDGEEPVLIGPANLAIERRHGGLTVQVWDERRNLVRRVSGIQREAQGRLVLRVERFGGRAGTLSFLDLARPSTGPARSRAARLEFREVFRRFLRRTFPAYKVAELSADANLQESLSPCYPRALLRQGSSAWAAIAAPSEGPPADGVLSFGLIWLDYLRRREASLAVRGLILLLPAGREKTTCLRLLYLNPQAACYRAFTYACDGAETEIDVGDYGNLATRLEPCRRRLPSPLDAAIARVTGAGGVERVERADGELSLRVRGLEFARTEDRRLRFGLETKRSMAASNLPEVERLAAGLARLRSPDAPDRFNPLYLRNRELWLESQTRNHIEDLDASLLSSPIYGQVPAFAACERGVLDLLAADRSGRLAVIELKAGEDIHLPLQALDYWMRVKWHLDRGEFTARGYFPGTALDPAPPRLMLVAPALEFHPSNERVLRYLDPAVEVERIGVGLEWRKTLKVMFRVQSPCR